MSNFNYQDYLKNNPLLKEEKKVGELTWKFMSDDQRMDALLSVVKDPDEAGKYIELDWKDLPARINPQNMRVYEGLEFDEDFGTGGEEVESLAADVVMGRISYKDAREKASKSAFSMKELNNAIAYVEDITGKSAPNYSIGEDYDPDAEQDDENVGMGYDDEGRPLGEAKDPRQIEVEREMRDQAKVFFLQKLRRGEIDTLPEDPFQEYMDMLTQTAIDHEAETLRREIDEGQRGDSKPGYSISDLTDRLDSIKMGTGNKYVIGRFNQEDKVIVKNSPELGVGTVYGVYPHKIDGKTANEMVYLVEFPNDEDEYYYDSELSFASKKDKISEAYKIGDEVILRGNSVVDDILKVVSMRKKSGSDLMAYKVEFPDGRVAEYDETELSLNPFRKENKMNKINERLNVARDALTKVYNELGATTFSKMILNLRDENVLDELANEMGNQYRGVMQEARDYGMTYPSYKVEEFNTIGDMAQNGILNLLAFAEQHKPELAGKLKSLANDVTEVIYDDMEEFDTQPRIRVKETIKEQVEEMVKGAVKVFQKEGGALGIKALEDGLSIDTKKAKALLKTMIKKDLVFLHRDGDYILKEGHGLTADDIKVIEKTIDDSSDAKLTDILKFIVSSNIEQAKRADLSKGK